MAKITKKAANKVAKNVAKKVSKKGMSAKSATRKAYDSAEKSVMAAVGRKTVKNRVKTVKTVASRAGKSALVAGGLAAAGVVVSEIRKRRSKA